MARYIDVNEIVKQIEEFKEIKEDIKTPSGDYMKGFMDALFATERLIADKYTADVAPVKHARWYYGRCTNCCHEALDYLNEDEGGCYMKTYITDYCPNCGAKMDGGKG